MISTLNTFLLVMLLLEMAHGNTAISNPYKFVWSGEGQASGLVRFFQDVNDDGTPDLFLGAKSLLGTGGGTFHIFKVEGNGRYQYLGSIEMNPSAFEVLSTKGNRLRDLKSYWHLSANEGVLSTFSFDGTAYKISSRNKIKSEDFMKKISPLSIKSEESGKRLNWAP